MPTQDPASQDRVPAGPGEPVLVVGLGNPGPQYAETRHNFGFRVVDLLAARMGARFSPHKTGADIAEGRLDGRRVILAKPRSYVNLSGAAVAGVLRYFSLPVDSLVVVHDELDLPFGVVRLKKGGGEGGHNGLRSVSASLGTKDYLRARFGIGRPPGRMDPADFVLRRFSTAERRELDVGVELTADAVEMLLDDGLEQAQNRFHPISG
ncbi:MAG: Peptidyl-tRNA hydrolase [Pseudonocardia sp.]|nr:Peptidyl-tRNA hydrolase [Pseudonocardia sp.]